MQASNFLFEIRTLLHCMLFWQLIFSSFWVEYYEVFILMLTQKMKLGYLGKISFIDVRREALWQGTVLRVADILS